MARTGRPPDPIPIKILKGRPNGTNSAGFPIPEAPGFDRGIPEPPDWLDAEAADVWRQVTPTLDRLDLLKRDDRQTLAAYCSAWSRFAAATQEYQREGVTITGDSGMPRIHPAVKVAEAAGRDLFRFAQDFGLTPAAEINLAKPRKAVTSDNDKFSGGDSATAAS